MVDDSDPYEDDSMGRKIVMFGPVLVLVALYQFYTGAPDLILVLSGVLLLLGLRDTYKLFQLLRARRERNRK